MTAAVTENGNSDARQMRPNVEVATGDEVNELENLIASARPKMTKMSHDDTSDFLDKLLSGEFGEVAVPAPTETPNGASSARLTVPSNEPHV